MWSKITKIEQLTALKVGTEIIKYPLEGEQKEDFDDSNPDEFWRYVVRLNNSWGNLQLGDPEIPSTLTDGSYSYHIGPVHKEYDRILNEEQGFWWIEK